MSVAAQTWAWAQKVPIKPKFVLVTLADQTDERTGKVCYQRTDAAFLADKCGVPKRSLYRYLGALIRNGYVTRSSGQKKGHASEYWLCLDRLPSADMEEFLWSAADEVDEPDEPQDVEGCAISADPQDDEKTRDFGAPGVPCVAQQDSLEKPKIPSRAREIVPKTFDRSAQDLERGIRKERTPEESEKVFVIEGTRAWDEWCRHQRARGKPGTLPTCTGQGKHAGRRGWYMPSLFPPPVGPPQLSNQDLKEFQS